MTGLVTGNSIEPKVYRHDALHLTYEFHLRECDDCQGFLRANYEDTHDTRCLFGLIVPEQAPVSVLRTPAQADSRGLDTPVAEAGFSERGANILRRCGCDSLRRVAARTGLFVEPGVGPETVQEVTQVLALYGVPAADQNPWLREDEPQAAGDNGGPPGPGRSEELPGEFHPLVGAGLMDDSAPLSSLDLTVRTFVALRRAGVRTVAELTRRTAADLGGIPRFGPKNLREVRGRLSALGLSLTGDDSDSLSGEDADPAEFGVANSLYALSDLSESINNAESAAFRRRVDGERNEYADGVEERLGVPDLAARLRRDPTRLGMMVSIETFRRQKEQPEA